MLILKPAYVFVVYSESVVGYIECYSMLKKLRSWLSSFFKYSRDCRIVEIDTDAQEVLFQIKNSSTLMRYKFSEAISDLTIVNRLLPSEACWLGGYYGRALRASLEGREALKKVKSMNFLLSSRKGRYTIAFQNRNGEVGYFDKKTRQEIVEHPLTIASHQHIISEFDPSQACYIGILAGLEMEKALASGKNRDQVEALIKKPAKLRLV